MKSRFIIAFIFVVIPFIMQAQTVWNAAKGTLTFTKAGFADWTQAANQDRISDSVWITRASSHNIFNIRKENAEGANSPAGTLWALGTTDSFATLQYKTFSATSGGSSQSLIGKNMVLQLVAEKIYLDIKIIAFGNQSVGASFSYVRAVSGEGTTSVISSSSPATFALEQNYPNPFNPITVIGYQLSATGQTSLIVYDAIGREVEVLVNDVKEAGSYSVQFDATHRTSGVYFARLTSGSQTSMKKLLLMK